MRNLIKKTLKRALWPVLPKPWDSADMEFHFGLWNGVSALYSESGRQLGEENARPFALNHHVPAETIHCKYKGSREGKPINMSALRVAMQNFDAAAAITNAVRSHHLGHVPKSHEIGIWDLYIISRASIALIAYEKRVTPRIAAQPTVSDALTSQYQFISGVFMICRHMMESAASAIRTNSPITADALYSYADENGIFISFNGMACAGSTQKIREFLDLCNNGAASQESAHFELAEIIGQPDNWYQYALATIEFDCFIEEERALKKLAAPDSVQSDLEQSAQIYADLGDYIRGLTGEAPPASREAFQDGLLLRQNVILQLLGRPVIGSIPAKHLLARLSG